MQQVTVDEAAIQLPNLIDAALRGEEVLIINEAQQTVKLTVVEPPPKLRHPRQFGSARGLIKMADDFDAPLEDFKEYME